MSVITGDRRKDGNEHAPPLPLLLAFSFSSYSYYFHSSNTRGIVLASLSIITRDRREDGDCCEISAKHTGVAAGVAAIKRREAHWATGSVYVSKCLVFFFFLAC